MSTKISVLNLVPKFENENPKEAVERATELAKVVDTFGYYRYWIAEHHNYPSVVSSATAIIIQHILQNTSNIRVGAGGIMLPNHTPLQVAETFGTLDVLYPKRVDLGLGRAPGTDSETAKLIYRGDTSQAGFIQGIQDLQRYFGPDHIQDQVKAIPATNRMLPLFILGSTTNSAKVAAQLGLPYAFAGHFSPHFLDEAVKIYREEFKPSRQLESPYFMLTLLGLAQHSSEDAKKMQSIIENKIVQSARGESAPYAEPDADFYQNLTTVDKFFIKTRSGLKLVGNQEEVTQQWQELKTKYNPDEVIITSYSPSLNQLIENYQILNQVINPTGS